MFIDTENPNRKQYPIGVFSVIIVYGLGFRVLNHPPY